MLKNSQPSKKHNGGIFSAAPTFNISDVCLFQNGSPTAAVAGCGTSDPHGGMQRSGPETPKAPEERPAKAIFSHSLREQLSLIYTGLPTKCRFVCFSCCDATKRKNNSNNSLISILLSLIARKEQLGKRRSEGGEEARDK